jgi:hypothetical protein
VHRGGVVSTTRFVAEVWPHPLFGKPPCPGEQVGEGNALLLMLFKSSKMMNEPHRQEAEDTSFDQLVPALCHGNSPTSLFPTGGRLKI